MKFKNRPCADTNDVLSTSQGLGALAAVKERASRLLCDAFDRAITSASRTTHVTNESIASACDVGEKVVRRARGLGDEPAPLAATRMLFLPRDVFYAYLRGLEGAYEALNNPALSGCETTQTRRVIGVILGLASNANEALADGIITNDEIIGLLRDIDATEAALKALRIRFQALLFERLQGGDAVTSKRA